MKQPLEEWQKIMDCCADPVIVYDKDGFARYISPSFERVFGWGPEELLGKRIDYVPENRQDQTRKAIEDVMAGKVVSGMETIRRTKSGQQIHARLSANAIKDDQGQYGGMVVTLQDITELVISRQKALDADHAKRDFLSNISHEIRTPMNGLFGMLDLLENTPLNDEQKEFMAILKGSAKALMSVISDLLDFSRIESGEIECSVIDFDLRVTMEEVRKTMSLQADKKGLQMTVEVDDQVHSLLKGDPEHLRKVMNHLIDNAVKFTQKGQIRVSVGCRSENEAHTVLEFEVADTGIGIREDQLNIIFDSFSQADATATRKYGGIGIGLSLSNQLVQLMGGQIKVNSIPGQGSRFGFVLEFEKQPAQVPVSNRIQQDIRHKKILIVDSDEANRAILKDMLKLWGADFQEAVNSERALEKLDPVKKNAYDIVLIAMQMSGADAGMDGETLAEKIRRNPQLSETLVIMLCAQGKRGDVTRLEKIGVEGYLPMPVEASVLFECMTAVLAMQGEKHRKLITRHFLRENKKQRFSVLLVQVGMVNRKIIHAALNKSGYSVLVANDKPGVQKILQETAYVIVLVDLESSEPEVLKELKQIQAPKNQDEIKMVIVVLADHDLTDTQKTIADDYILKPLTSRNLSEIVGKWA
ncbi:MAG: response regulator, partial [Proteobacteria bacterium]|nr:response regulator [Pseudomonadota bacterium]